MDVYTSVISAHVHARSKAQQSATEQSLVYFRYILSLFYIFQHLYWSPPGGHLQLAAPACPSIRTLVSYVLGEWLAKQSRPLNFLREFV